MSTSITGVAGFDQAIYDKLLVQYTEATGKTQADLDGILMQKINGKMSFMEAVNQVQASRLCDEMMTVAPVSRL